MTGFRPFAARGPQHVQAYIDLLIEKHAVLGEHYVKRMLDEAVVELDRLQSSQALPPEAAHQGGQGAELEQCVFCGRLYETPCEVAPVDYCGRMGEGQ